MTEAEARRIYAALRSELYELSVQQIRNTVAAAGIDVTRLTARAEARSGLGSRAEVMPAVDRLFGELELAAKLTALHILAERIVAARPDREEELHTLLGKHGYQFADGSFIPVGLLDEREKHFLSTSSASELSRAMARLLDGDVSGAVTSACGAVDLATQAIYHDYGIGDPGKASFQAKVNTALGRTGVFDRIEEEYAEIGISADEAHALVQEMRKATNHAAHSLQMLRRSMGDVHGSRPALRSAAYDAIKWASAICGLLVTNGDG